MQVADNLAVYLHFTLTNKDGEVLDSSDGQAPLGYLHGNRNLIPGLENALTGKQEGDEFDVVIEPSDAYGEYSEALVQEVDRSLFKDAPQLEPGMQFQAQTPAGPHVFTVLKVGDEAVTIDGNHALAGETLHFHVKIDSVREATSEELEHGHLHAVGGCHGCDDGGCCDGGCSH